MSVLTYKCRNCGSALKFNAKEQNWSCDACLSTYKEAELKEIETEELKDTMEDDPSWEPEIHTNASAADREFEARTKAYNCPSCGAEIVTDETTAATFCCYCHNPTILPGQLSGVYKPSKVIPFLFKKEEVTEIFRKWCRKKPLLPGSFKSQSQIEKLTGIYIPFWLFDCDIDGSLSASATRVRSWTSGNTRYTETKTYDVYREIAASFDRVPADGSKKADDDLMERLEPFDYSKIKDFSMSYLSGYIAEKYDEDSKSVFPRIQQRVKDYSHGLLRDTINGYSSVSERGCRVRLKNVKADYALLPTWMLTYGYKERRYFFAMNGQTGKIAGKLPICKLKAMLWFLGITAIVYSILLVGGMFI